MDGAGLRAETAEGDVYDGPTDALLLRLLGELGPENRFLVVDRLDATNDQHYMQVFREDDGTFAVEYREGGAERHFEAAATDLREVHGILTGWATRSPGWRDRCAWRRWPIT